MFYKTQPTALETRRRREVKDGITHAFLAVHRVALSAQNWCGKGTAGMAIRSYASIAPKVEVSQADKGPL
jgi:hypothetical protein